MTKENKEAVSLLLQTYKDIRTLLMSAPGKIYGIRTVDFGIVNMNFGFRFIEIRSSDFILENVPDCLQIYYISTTESIRITNYFTSIGTASVIFNKCPNILYFLLRVKTYLEELINDQRGETINK